MDCPVVELFGVQHRRLVELIQLDEEAETAWEAMGGGHRVKAGVGHLRIRNGWMRTVEGHNSNSDSGDELSSSAEKERK